MKARAKASDPAASVPDNWPQEEAFPEAVKRYPKARRAPVFIPDAATIEKEEAFQAGRADARRGVPVTSNPHQLPQHEQTTRSMARAAAWELGWHTPRVQL